MAEFTPITSQEQLDKVISERIRRAEEKAAEKYADYNDIKTQNTGYATQIAQLTEQVKKQTETINGHAAVVDDLNAKVQKYETASVKTQIALELGLPYQMADRLTGTDEESIRKDAENMKTLIGAQTPAAPIGSNEPQSDGGKTNAWATVSAGLRE